MSSPESAATILDRGLQRLEISVGSAARAHLLQLAELLEDWAPRMNLSGHRDAPGIVQHLVLDAIALTPLLPEWHSLADIGSGAGFPGLPLACLAPDRTVRLIESRERRHHFQREAVRRMGLRGVIPVRGRAGEIEPVPSDLVIARAVAPPDRIVPLLVPWSRPGGWIAVPLSGPQVPPGHHPDLERAKLLDYGTGDRSGRRLWLARRTDARNGAGPS